MPALPDRLNLDPEDLRSYTDLLNVVIFFRIDLANRGYHAGEDVDLVNEMRRILQMIVMIGRRIYNEDDQEDLELYIEEWHEIFEEI
ncbi:hypothetical protein CAEBREN_12438 [Caenorhabditis brenneri]|uniref:Uncharacterized protein n=1 Tax=Caenorhabditis brenneri TaxID=135651 RepID=G0MY80_CAEBE|nr:hypothetical protein CAEBREN_12438 [Caenorhabditis brenneri]